MRFVRGRATNGLFWRALGGSGGEPAPPGISPAAGAKRRTAGGHCFVSRCKAGGPSPRRKRVADRRCASPPLLAFSPPSKGRSCGSSECLRRDGMTSAKTDALFAAPATPPKNRRRQSCQGRSSHDRCGRSPCKRDVARKAFRSSLKSFPDGTSSLAAMPREMALVASATPASRPARSLSQAM